MSSDQTAKDTLGRILDGKPLEWTMTSALGPCVTIYYPSEEAFINTLSRRKGGPSLTREGDEMRKAARQMRTDFMTAFPAGRVGFDIRKSDQP